MSIRVSDPLFLLSAQTGLSVGELKAKAAAGNPDLEKRQEALKTGEPIPILFGRFRNGSGGVMVQPKITEAYFSNSIVEKDISTDGGTVVASRAIERLELKYLAVLTEGNMPQLQVRDLFHGTCRRGTYNQAYSARAGTWSPGNETYSFFTYTATLVPSGAFDFNITTLSQGESVAFPGSNTYYYRSSDNNLYQRKKKEYGFPVFCGNSGSYSGLTTLSFEYNLNDPDSENVTKTLNIFIRNGLQVTRLVDSVTAQSDNYVDLVKYLFQTNNRLADDLIDDTALTTAANFTDTNSFLFNGAVTESHNLLDWIQQTSVNFLLRITNSGGKFGLQPRLPYNTDYTIKTTQVTPEFTFTEEHVVDGGFEIEYISLEDRQPVCFVIQWRQQPEANFGLVRTVEVRYTSEATSGPFVDIDMSGYCTNENHAVKVGAFRLAQRKFITHHLRLTVREYSYNSTLAVGDLVRVRLRRETDQGEVEYHDKLYEINRIQKTFSSTIVYDLTHFPIDSQGRSIIAREVADAVGAGNTINVGRTTFDCDENSATDNTPIGTSSGGGGSNQPSSADTLVEVPLPQPDDVDSPYPDGPSNPADPLEESVGNTSAITVSGSNTGYGGSSVTPGNQVAVPTSALPCEGRVCYYRLDKETGEKTLRECVTTPISGNYFSYITTADISYAIIAEGQCPDSASDDGFGVVILLGETAPVVPDPTAYGYVRWSGTRITYDPGVGGDSYHGWVKRTDSHTTQWYQYDGSTPNQYLTVGSAWGAIGGLIYDYKIVDPVFTQPYISDYGEPLAWSPWVNYYDYVTNQHVGTAGVVGVPWRSHVFAAGSRFTTSGGFGLSIGMIGGVGFGLNLLPNPIIAGASPHVLTAYLPAGSLIDTPARAIRLDGVWEFSNDGSTVLAEWKGTNDSGHPYIGSSI